jgi:hypothetical protein
VFLWIVLLLYKKGLLGKSMGHVGEKGLECTAFIGIPCGQVSLQNSRHGRNLNGTEMSANFGSVLHFYGDIVLLGS